MLCKKACQTCITRYSHSQPWDYNDEDNWNKRNRVYCPMQFRDYDKQFLWTGGRPPKRCKYRLEHIVWQAAETGET